jgi:hypothetical protein
MDQSPLRRSEPRTTVVLSEVKGIATRANGREHGPFIVWDISDNGLRLWVPERMPAGEVVQLTIAKPMVVMLSGEVRWCSACEDEPGFQLGVRVLDNLQRLEALHKAVCAA